MSFVTAIGLNKFYQVGAQHIHVLRDLELNVNQGEMTAILGGLDRAESGTVEIDGTNLSTLSDAALVEYRNRHVGFVFQFHHLLPEFDAAENVEMPMRVARIPRDQSRRRASDLLSRV